ncbi:MAG TPA: aspartate aminotransferase family protein [Candidatus Acidoferrales bacterium]|nr:aspartate aminotransferase family protein [Candidatus Acidoferrales bacterium]
MAEVHAGSEYVRRTKLSNLMFERARKIEPAGVSYRFRHFEPYPFFVKEARGAKLIDIDDNEYTDYWCTHFAMILGHANPVVMQAIKSQAEKGWHFGLAHKLEIELAETIRKHVPSAELFRYTSSGSEANFYAIRLARTFTKRDKIAKFEGCWHGAYDPVHLDIRPPFNKPLSGGIPRSSQADTIVAQYNDLDAFLSRVKGESLACVILEPVMGAGGMIPAEREFLRGLREYCDESGAQLIFDEVITGFRLGLGGAQEHYGVKSDVTVMGKIIGGGLPIGLVAGNQEIMNRMDHTKYSGTEYAYHGGTFAGNAITLAAGIATINVLEQTPVYQHVNKLGEKTRRAINGIFNRYDFPAQTSGIGSLFGIHTTSKKPIRDVRSFAYSDHEESKRIFGFFLENGILMVVPEMLHGSISYAHTDADVDHLAETIEKFVKRQASAPRSSS